MYYAHMNLDAIKGEQGTGFEKENGLGEFECGNCLYFRQPNECHQADMMRRSQQPRNSNGSVVVAEEDCCEYVDRIGIKEEEEHAEVS